MMPFLIKVGKAWNVLKTDGAKRIFSAAFIFYSQIFKSFFKQWKKGDALLVSGGVAGDSSRYRTQAVSEELNLKGIKTDYTFQENPFLSIFVDNYSIFVFHRVFYNPKIAKIIQKIKSQGKEIIFETDDLVFDPKYIQGSDYFQNINELERKMYENGLGRQILRDPYVKACTTTTSFLAEKLAEYNKKVFIVPNRLTLKDLEIADEVIRRKPKKAANCIRIGYFSGTYGHNRDFATITDVLMNLMEKHPGLELFLAGPLNIDSKLDKHGDRIKQLSRVSRAKHFENISEADINIVPLEMENPFCEAKSELKFFEAGIVETPTVAVANRTFSEAIDDGVDGFLAKDELEWKEKLEKLICDKNLRIEMGRKAREKALKKYSTKNADNSEYYNYLKEKIIK